MKIIAKSNFHNSRAELRPRPDGTITYRQLQRAEKLCCGQVDCRCPIIFHDQDGARVFLTPVSADWKLWKIEDH